MDLKFTRKLNRSNENMAAQIIYNSKIPRCIAQAWSEFDAIELVFEDDMLKIVAFKMELSVDHTF